MLNSELKLNWDAIIESIELDEVGFGKINLEWIVLVLPLLFIISIFFIFWTESSPTPNITSISQATHTRDWLFNNPDPNKTYPLSRKIFEQIALNESVDVNSRIHYWGFAKDNYNLTLSQEKVLAKELEKDSFTCNQYSFGYRWVKNMRTHVMHPCIFVKNTNSHPIADLCMLQVAIKYETNKYNNKSK